jgi:uncharacterized protein (DUF427 family)
MPRAMWNGQVLAEAAPEEVEIVEGNVYFPADKVNPEFLTNSPTHTICPWKGEASYYHVQVEGETNKDAAWYYPETKPAANNIKGYIAFWRGVKVER